MITRTATKKCTSKILLAALSSVYFLCSAVFFTILSTTGLNASELGDDGLHKQDWFALTFKDIEEDWRDASDQGKHLVLVYEQRGCIYCERTHATVLSDPEVVSYLKENFVVVQYNLFGDEEVTDLDGEVLSEKTAAEKWDVMFTPTWIFLPEAVLTGKSLKDVAVGQMPGAFGKGTFLDLFTWVNEKGYEGDESFQRYHGRRDRERRAAKGEG